jgi:hypothetical protein
MAAKAACPPSSVILGEGRVSLAEAPPRKKEARDGRPSPTMTGWGNNRKQSDGPVKPGQDSWGGG